MALSVQCPACGTGHKAPERAAGRILPCLVCKTLMTVPTARPIDPAEILLRDDDAPLPIVPTPAVAEPHSLPPPPKPRKKPKTVDVASLPPLTSDDPPFWRRHLHWLLVLALLPLVVTLLGGFQETSPSDRINKWLEQLQESPDEKDHIVRDRIINEIKRLKQTNPSEQVSVDDVIPILPDQKLPGAFLSHTSLGHWLIAALATLFYMAFFMFLASDGSAKPTHVLFVGLFTATIGIGFLLLVQMIAFQMGGRMFVGFNIVAIIFIVLKFIAFSYSAAVDPNIGFGLSFLGFTAGVGLCEECVKVIPVFWHRSTRSGRTWRGMLIWGLASGAGFGIAEGIMYSSRYYNGISGPGIYLVRFLSCVALHSIWTSSAAVLLYIRRDLFDGIDRWYEWIFPTLLIIGIPMVLHGLYDTCLKKDMNGVALLVAFASFGYLAFLFSRLQTVDDKRATEALLREYERRKSAMA